MPTRELRHRLTVRTVTGRTRNTDGGYSETIAADRTVWGAVEPLPAREQVQSERLKMTLTHRITIRAGTTLRHGDLVLFKTRALYIEAVQDLDERGRYLVATAAEGGAQR